jgi:hypothetical protein
MKERPVQQETQATIDATMAAVGSKATYTGASASVLGWMISSEFGVLFGLFLGLVGLCVNWFYKHKEDKRQQAEHDRRMQGH